MFAHTIWVYFVHLNFQHTKIQWFEEKNTIINVSRHVLQFVCLPVQNMPSSGILVAHVSVMTSHCCTVGFGLALCVVSALNSQDLYFCCKVWAFTIFFLLLEAGPCWNYFHREKKCREGEMKRLLLFLKRRAFLSVLLFVFNFKCK